MAFQSVDIELSCMCISLIIFNPMSKGRHTAFLFRFSVCEDGQRSGVAALASREISERTKLKNPKNTWSVTYEYPYVQGL
jgi:hypothetical protein